MSTHCVMISSLVQIYLLKLLLLKVSAFTGCQISLHSVRHGARCPEDAESWQMAASIMNCESIQQQCSESLGLDPQRFIFQYHCLINSRMNAIVEVCALNRSILGYCAEFNEDGALIQDNYHADCKNYTPQCPTFYNSAEAYKYQWCYHLVYRHQNYLVSAGGERPISSKSSLFMISICHLIHFFYFVLIEFIYNILTMKCGDNAPCSKSNVQRKNTKQEQSNHGPLQKLDVASGAMKE